MKRFTKVALLLFACSILLSIWVIVPKDTKAASGADDYGNSYEWDDGGRLTSFTASTTSTQVKFPDDVKTIPDNIFGPATNVEYINFNNVETIELKAFYACESLTSVDMPNVKTIGDQSFYQCTGLTTVTLPKVQSVPNTAFDACGNLTDIIVPDTNNYYFSDTDGLLVAKPSGKLIKVPEGKQSAGIYDLPDCVKEIGADAFKNSQITNVRILDTVTSIEEQTGWGGVTIYGGTSGSAAEDYYLNHADDTLPNYVIAYVPEGGGGLSTTFTVTYLVNDGTTTVYLTVSDVASGSKLASPTAPTRAGYEFDGWYKEEACTNLWAFATDTVTADTNLYAKWTASAATTYTVTFSANGYAATGMPAAQTVNANGTATAPTTNPTCPGYSFQGWYSDAAYTTPYDFTTPVTADKTLYAKWTANSATTTYTVQFSLNGKSGTKPGNQTVAANGKVTRPSDPTASGYTFTGWYTTAACTTAWNFDANVVTNNMTLYAGWTANTGKSWTVVFNMNGHGGLIASQTIADGGLVNKPADPRADGYVFGGWFTDNGFTTEWNFSANKVTKDMTLYAKWTKGDSSSSTNGGSSNSNGSTGSGSGGNGGSNTSGRDVTPQTADNSIDPRFILVFVLFLSGVGMIVYSRFSQMKYMSDNRRD